MTNLHTDTTRAVRARDAAPVNNDALVAYVERIARLHTERKEIADMISEVLTEAEQNGFAKKQLKQAAQIFLEDSDARSKRRDGDEILDVYLVALGLA